MEHVYGHLQGYRHLVIPFGIILFSLQTLFSMDSDLKMLLDYKYST